MARSRPRQSDHVEEICRNEQIQKLRSINPKLTDALLDHSAYFRSGKLNRTALRRATNLSPREIRRGLDELRGGLRG